MALYSGKRIAKKCESRTESSAVKLRQLCHRMALHGWNWLDVGQPEQGLATGSMILGFEAISKIGESVRYSIDGIRIQNHPDR